jgi:LssY C-terminus
VRRICTLALSGLIAQLALPAHAQDPIQRFRPGGGYQRHNQAWPVHWQAPVPAQVPVPAQAPAPIQTPVPAPEAAVVAPPSDGCAALESLLHDAPQITYTKEDLPGDALNIALVGTREEIVTAFQSCGWYSAAPITLRSAAGITISVALNVPYRRAPVSNLYLFGRKQDLAFESPAGRSARTRHHVRFWCLGIMSPDGRPIWIGAATLDAWVGRSYTTGKITHHIAPAIDPERDKILNDLSCCGLLAGSCMVSRCGPTEGYNGEGDYYFSDGNLGVGILAH